MKPLLLHGLRWDQAANALSAVDCALRRPHWCGPVLVLRGKHLFLDDEGDFSRVFLTPEERGANDWQMVARTAHDGSEIEPRFRAAIAIETAKPMRRETGSARKGESAGLERGIAKPHGSQPVGGGE